jgi:glucose-specific phosphotransferase system IIA component
MPELTVRAPVAGVVVAMADVPDPVFGAQLVGPGVAIDPVRDGDVDVVAPIDGTLVKVHPHAFVVAASDGRAALVHLGLDTVQLGGEGFTLRAAEGDAVRAGDVVVTWRPADVEAGGRSPVCPVVALDAPAEQVAAVPAVGARVGPGEPLLTWR